MFLKALLVNVRAYKKVCEPCDQLNRVIPGVQTEEWQYICQGNMSNVEWMADNWWFI